MPNQASISHENDQTIQPVTLTASPTIVTPLSQGLLTKTDFLCFLESPLHLWAKKHGQIDPKTPDLYTHHIANQGYQVEKLAKLYLKHKVETQYPNADLSFQVTLTADGYSARLDALVHDKNFDTYDIYEIKSGTSIHTEYEYDLTFQYLLGKQNLNLHKIYLVRVNSDYVKKGEIDLQEFFIIDDMMPIVEKRRDEVMLLIKEAQRISQDPTPPLAFHCYKPSKCSCKSLCHPNLNDYSIYELGRCTKKQLQQFSEGMIENIVDIPDDFPLNPCQRLQVQSVREKQPIINSAAISNDLKQLQFPLYFLDYETFGMAIPIYDGYTPYQDIIFQYSIHMIESPESEVKHYEYLATETDEPSLELVKRLTSVIGEKGSIIVWNKSFECSRNQKLANLQPSYRSHLESINQRTYDLMDPFKKGFYVDYRFHGSNSIKKVLPILVPELRYKDLEIGEGTAAMMAWYQITHDTNSAFTADSIHLKDKVKQDLLKYCELDTLAMVEIWKKLVITNLSTE